MQIYLTTFLTDVIIFFVIFFVMYRAGETGMSGGLCTLLGISGSIGYIITSFVSGRVIRQKNCKQFLLASTVAGALACIAVFFSKSFALDLVLLFAFGMANGFFFNAFQAFIRNSSSRADIFKTISMYTVAWSTGTAFGYLGSGSLYKLGPYALSFIIVLSAVWIVYIIRGKHCVDNSVVEEPEYPFGTDPVYLWIGWIIIFAVTFTERALQVFFPVLCAKSGISPFMAGLPLFLMMFTQGAFAMFFTKYKNLFYRKNLIITANIAAVLLLLVLWLFPYYPVYLAGFTLFGVYGAFTYFSSVLYANNHFENRSLNVGINEAIVGIGAVIGVVISYVWMKFIPGAGSIYLGCALLMILAIAAILFFHRKPKAQHA